MAYMNKRGAEAMGDVAINPFTGMLMDSSSGASSPVAETPVYCWNGQTVPASQCPPQPATAAPKAASDGIFGLSTTELAVVAGLGVGAYFLMKRRRR